jgi:WD40 repeat protein
MSRLAQLRRTKSVQLTTRWQAAIGDHTIAMAWSPGGDLLAAASVSGPITLFDGSTGAIRHTLPGHHPGTMSVSWRPDSRVLASGGQDGKVRLWDAVSGEETGVLAGGSAWVERVAWNRTSPAEATSAILATAAGRTLSLWSAQGELSHQYRHDSTIQDIQWRPGGRDLVMAAYGGIAFLHPERTDKVRQFKWQGAAWVLACSPDGKYVATGDQDSTIHFWEARTGKDLQMWGYPTKVRELAWDSRSRYLASGGSATVIVWDCSGRGPEGTTPIQLKAHEDLLSVLAFQQRGDLLASGGKDSQVILWQPGRSETPVARKTLSGPISQICWSANDQRLAVGDDVGTVAVYEVRT